MTSPCECSLGEVHWPGLRRGHRIHPLLCQLLMKILVVINPVCACVRPSAEDDDFQRLVLAESHSRLLSGFSKINREREKVGG